MMLMIAKSIQSAQASNSRPEETAILLRFLFFIAIVTSVAHPLLADEANDFHQHIEPLLAEKCYPCHSHSSNSNEGGLVLDWQSGWSIGGDSGPAIVPGNTEESLLIQAIRREGIAMPPDEPLSDHEVELLTQWVKAGAFDPRQTKPADESDKQQPTDWWSLRPLNRPAIPDSILEYKNPIDRFTQHSLAAHGLSLAPLASRRQIIVRLYVDLLGLLPTLEEITEFERDKSPLATENLIDRLLASPQYGVRWARHWLDTIHFADTHGFEHDVLRPNAWPFRDYVIDSFNQDVSWEKFVRDQLAADVFSPDQPNVMAALGFLGAGPFDLSTFSTAPVTFDYLDRDDIVAQTMSAFASTTANCARCHAHKFDPISQEDYYALQAVFSGVGKGDIFFDADIETGNLRRHWQSLQRDAQRRDPMLLASPEIQQAISKWEDDLVNNSVTWSPMQVATFTSHDGSELQRLQDSSILVGGPRPDVDTYSVTGSTSLAKITGIRLEVLADPSLPMQGPGRQDNGNLHLSEWSVQLFDPHQSAPVPLIFSTAVADYDQTDWGILLSLDGNPRTAWGIHPEVSKDHAAVFVLTHPVELSPGSQLAVHLRQLHGQGHLIGRFRISVTDSPNPTLSSIPAEVQSALDVTRDRRTEAQHLTIAAFVTANLAKKSLAALPAQQVFYGAYSTYSVVNGAAADHRILQNPKTVHLLQRGDIDKPKQVAEAGALSAINAIPARFSLSDTQPEALRRAQLAEWFVHRDNPLTWRSIVNRIWHFHFGRGLSDTPSDFGRMGSIPTHPELLDWLACEFRDQGGSLKQLHRLICSSQTYLQSPHATSSSQAIDSDNRLLSRAPLRRLDAETFRDSMLHACGLMDFRMGGPGVQNFLTSPGAQLTPNLDYLNYDWLTEGATRRSIYRIVWRGIPDPLMEALDFPDLGLLSPTRGQSSSALQSLATLNHNLVLYSCDSLANEITRQSSIGNDIDAQVHQAFQRVLLRSPSQDEKKTCNEYVTIHGLAALIRVLLNSNEFHYID